MILRVMTHMSFGENQALYDNTHIGKKLFISFIWNNCLWPTFACKSVDTRVSIPTLVDFMDPSGLLFQGSFVLYNHSLYRMQIAHIPFSKLIIIIKNYFVKKPYGIVINIEHHIERVSLFTIIILGEVIAGIMWSSYSRDFSSANVATVCGIIIAISIQYIYYFGDGEDVRDPFF
jgi:low temperature requirement protein LtrA